MSQKLSTRKRYLILALICSGPIAVSAQAISAQDLERLCSAKTDTERLPCLLMVKAYMDGFIEGVAKGVLDTYKFDERLSAQVKNDKVSTVVGRASKVIERSTCLQKVAVQDMAKTFVDYVGQNPEVRTQNYRIAMTRSLNARYCTR